MGKELLTDLENFVIAMEAYKNYFSGLCIMCDLKGQEKELTQRELLKIGKEKGIIVGPRFLNNPQNRIWYQDKNGEQVTMFEMGLYKSVFDSTEKLNSIIAEYCLSNAGNTKELERVLKLKEGYFNDFNSYNCLKEILPFQNTMYWYSEVVSKEILVDKRTKIKWVGKPSHFGYIFSELAEKGLIEYPKTYGTVSMAKYAKQLFEVFDIDCKEKTLIKEINPSKNTTGNFNRLKIKIPNISDLK